jgi:hypothetical protein
MKTLERRVQHLEGLYGPTAPLPWETAGWEQLSQSEQMQECEQYMAAHPQSRLARQWRAIEALSDRELEELLEAAEALAGDTPHRSRAG